MEMAGSRACDQQVEHSGGVWAAVNIIAKKDVQSLRGGMFFEVPINPQEELLEQIRPAVDIAHRVDAKPLFQRWRRAIALRLPHLKVAHSLGRSRRPFPRQLGREMTGWWRAVNSLKPGPILGIAGHSIAGY
jgi:hypothetical protein